jgi:drug/metabolite transporter (DMT)-like permease
VTVTQAPSPPREPVDSRRASLLRFARDVAVNVLANLLAAAVIYVVGAFAGLLPKSRDLITVSVVIIVAGVALLVAAVGYTFFGGRARLHIVSAGIFVLGIYFLLAPLAPDGLDTVDRILAPFMGFALVALSVLGEIIMYSTRRDGTRLVGDDDKSLLRQLRDRFSRTDPES